MSAAAANASPIKALVFDVFGTVVDWRSSIIREGKALAKRKGIGHVDWAEFADAWRAGYGPAMNRVRKGELPWMNIDPLHRLILDGLLVRFKIDGLEEADKEHFNRAWHRLDAWPDSARGLTLLRKKFICATLSNGNVSLLVNMAKYAGLQWDTVLSAELMKAYKPDAIVYQRAAEMLGAGPAETLMVAAHKGDLQGARRAGLKAAFVERPLEKGPGGKADTGREDWMDYYARDFVDLAKQLGVRG
ncbi:MAG: haloacid dehalogenase type II [Acidobacteria bacterium]|nr:haloacid dehalogenase type II [Acidobacteriota bacterium]